MTDDTSSLQSFITALAEPLAVSLGLNIWGVEVAFGKRGIVRVFVDADSSKQDMAQAAKQEADHVTNELNHEGLQPEAVVPEDTFELAGFGVDIERCAELSRLLGMALDVEDCIPGAYTLEVSSPGLERRFFNGAQLASAVGQTVIVSLHNPLSALPGRRNLQGILERADNGVFTLAAIDFADSKAPTTSVSFIFEQVKKAKQVHVVQEKVLPGKGGIKNSKAKKTKEKK